MKTLNDYIRGHTTPVYLIAKHGDYSLTMTQGNERFYFMKKDQVLKMERYPDDLFYQMSVRLLNNKNDEEAKTIAKEQRSYKAFKKFIKDETGEEFII